MTDAVLVRAPIGATYRTLTDLDAWPRWRDGCRSRRLDVAGSPDDRPGADRHVLVLPGLRRPLQLRIVAHGWQHDARVRWEVQRIGRVPSDASVEWWFEEVREGTIVHHLLHDVPSGRRTHRAVQRYRCSVMLTLQAMKDHLELAVAHAAGRVP